MTVERSKRRSFLALIFIVQSVSKNLLIRIFKRKFCKTTLTTNSGANLTKEINEINQITKR